MQTHPNLISIITSQMMAAKQSHENRPILAFLSLHTHKGGRDIIAISVVQM